MDTQLVSATSKEEAALSLSQRYRRFVFKRTLLLSSMLLALVIAWAFDTATGPSHLGIDVIWQALTAPDSLDAVERVIIFDVRIPYA
ncbi:hypothetical protein [Photobacterium swingsii]|nr:hypothetical protein [Photobacterium swingsii]